MTMQRTIDSPIGPLTISGDDDGLRRIEFTAGGGRSGLDEAAEQLAQFFAGERRTFDLPLALDAVPPFRRRVLDHLDRAVGYGATTTYAEVAASLGAPAAVRAVGTGCATNPLPIVVPCHRVLRTDGGLGGYLGGLDAKRWLLDHEAA